MAVRSALLLLLAFAAACAARGASPTTEPASRGGADPNLNAVLWMQSALEYEASARQAYRAAQLHLDSALRSPNSSAVLEQPGAVAGLPPAVILDVDETVLDNSFYQARMIRAATAYSEQTWSVWVEERRATAVPGALEFTRYAAERGVAVFYVTNRTASGEQATRDNLSGLGFALDSGVDTVLTRGERPEWQSSAKTPRRLHVARHYRVLLLIGDDLGDFIDPAGSPEERRARAAAHSERWGREWIMLPNPTYGSWERAVVGSSPDPVAAKRRALLFEPR